MAVMSSILLLDVSFPLIPAFSLGEKEKHLPVADVLSHRALDCLNSEENET